MQHYNRLISTVLFLGIIFTASFVCAMDQRYILTFTERETIVLLRITKTDSGIRTAPPVIHNFGRTVGRTAVDPIIDAAGTLRDLRVYVSFVDRNNRPAVSLLRFGSQFEFISESSLTNLNLGGYIPLHIQKVGSSGRRLFGLGRNGSANANDFVSYTLNDSGVSTGSRKTYINNAPGVEAFGGFATRDGGMVGALSILPATTPNSIPFHQQCVRVIGNNANPIGNIVCTGTELFTYYSKIGTNIVNGTRDIIFREFRNPGTSNSQSRLLVEKVEANTGEEIGQARALTNFVRAPELNAEIFQGIAVSEDGGLVVFNSLGPCQREVVKAFRRGSNGLRVGGIATIYGCNRIGSGENAYAFSMASL